MRLYWGADKSLARPTSRCILFDGKNISFDASLVIYTEGPKKCIHILRKGKTVILKIYW